MYVYNRQTKEGRNQVLRSTVGENRKNAWEREEKKTKLRSSYSSLLPEVLYLSLKNTYYLGTLFGTDM